VRVSSSKAEMAFGGVIGSRFGKDGVGKRKRSIARTFSERQSVHGEVPSYMFGACVFLMHEGTDSLS